MPTRIRIPCPEQVTGEPAPSKQQPERHRRSPALFDNLECPAVVYSYSL